MQMIEFSVGEMYENLVIVLLAACIYYFGKWIESNRFSVGDMYESSLILLFELIAYRF